MKPSTKVDYQARIDREASSGRDLSTTMANLAETYMMLGDLDRAIAAYESVRRLGSDASATFGLAVALDRDGQGVRARELARGVGLDGFELYKTRVEQTGEIFYVPEGERYYYFALVEEALGLDTSARAACPVCAKPSSLAYRRSSIRTNGTAAACLARVGGRADLALAIDLLRGELAAGRGFYPGPMMPAPSLRAP